VRNLLAGAPLQALAHALGMAHVASQTLFMVGAGAWGVTQLADAAIFVRLGSRTGALAVGVLALILAVAALFACMR
jgi:hypothetical protein